MVGVGIHIGLSRSRLDARFKFTTKQTDFPQILSFFLLKFSTVVLCRCGGSGAGAQSQQHPGLCELRHHLGLHQLRGGPVHGRDFLHHHQGDPHQCRAAGVLRRRLCKKAQRGSCGNFFFFSLIMSEIISIYQIFRV